ncbi:MAG: hypothetical protein ACYC9X_06095 [Dehalococcoidia bacterium]
MRRIRRLRSSPLLALVGLAALALVAVACGSNTPTTAQSSKNGFNPPAPTPGTPNPAYVIQSLDDAIAKATNAFVGKTSEHITTAHVQSLTYVQTTAGQAYPLMFNGQKIDPASANKTAWLFVERGDFQDLGGTMHATPGPVVRTLLVLAIEGDTSLLVIPTDQAINLASLGTPVVIPPGRIPQVDRIRAPVSAAATAAATPTP